MKDDDGRGAHSEVRRRGGDGRRKAEGGRMRMGGFMGREW